MNLLAIDIGNTNITVGLFVGKRLYAKTKVPTAAPSKYGGALVGFFRRSRFDLERVEGVIVSSVVPKALERLRPVLRKHFARRIYVVGIDVKAPIANRYRTPRQVGQDRLVNAVAAKALYGCPAIVIDFGTALTFDCVSRKGEYLGGLILPGIDLSLQGLYEWTALLPKTTIAPVRHIIGKDTVESIRSGILFGFGAMADGLAKRLREVIGARGRVIMTGGSSELMRRYARMVQVVDPDLTLKGLRIIFQAIFRKTG